MSTANPNNVTRAGICQMLGFPAVTPTYEKCSNASRPRQRESVCRGQVFWTTILGNAAEWSCCFSAIFTATRRAICL